GFQFAPVAPSTHSLSEWHRDRGPQGGGIPGDRGGQIRAGTTRAVGPAPRHGAATSGRTRPLRAAHRVRPARLPGAALRPEPSRRLAARPGPTGRGTAAGPAPRRGDEFRRPAAVADVFRFCLAGGGATLERDRV